MYYNGPAHQRMFPVSFGSPHVSVVTMPSPRVPHLTQLLNPSLSDSSSLLLSLSVVFQVSVDFSWAEVCRVLSDVPSLETLSNRYQSIFPLPSSPPTLECNWLSRLAPLRFLCNPSLAKSQSSSQMFGSSNVHVTPKVFAIQSYLSFNAPMLRHDTYIRRSTPLNTILNCGNLTFALLTSEYNSPIS